MRLATLLLLAPLTAAAAPTSYSLTGGELAVLVKYDRSTLMKGHDHVLLSTGFSGQVTLDPDDLASCDIRLTLPVESLQVDPGDARARYGLEGTTGDGDKKSIKKNALSSGQLDVSNHPNITFKSTGCAMQGDKLEVTGKLTIRGNSHTVKARVTTSQADDAFTAKTRFTATHADFGFKPYSALLGALKNDEELTFVVDVKGKRAQ